MKFATTFALLCLLALGVQATGSYDNLSQWVSLTSDTGSKVKKFLDKITHKAQDKNLDIIELRLVHMKKRSRCSKKPLPFNHCRSFVNGRCQCWGGYKNPNFSAAWGEQRCDVWRPKLRHCVSRETSGLCHQCQPSYYLMGGMPGTTGEAADPNETAKSELGQCRMGWENCSPDCPFCRNSTQCHVRPGWSKGCRWNYRGNKNAQGKHVKSKRCYMCKEGWVIERGTGICIRVKLLDGNILPLADPKKPTTKRAGQGLGEQLKEHVFSGCAKATSKVSPTNPDGPLTWTCLHCRPDHKAVPVDSDGVEIAVQDANVTYDQMTDLLKENFMKNLILCRPADQQLDATYRSCMTNHPEKVTYEKWFQVIWEMNLVPKDKQSEWFKDKYEEKQQNKWWATHGAQNNEFAKLETQSSVRETGEDKYAPNKLLECQRAENADPMNVSTGCQRLLSSYYMKHGKFASSLDSLRKVVYRAIVSMHMTRRIVGDKSVKVWVFDQDFVRKTLMWSQTGKFGPWVQIPWGCPTIIVKGKLTEKIINKCEWYHKVGKEIKSVANFAGFLPEHPNLDDGSGTATVETPDVVNSTEAWKEALQSGEDYQPPESTTPKGGIARCLLKKIVTISETKTVQCFFKGLADGDTPPIGWIQGLPQKDGQDLKIADILDCKYMLSAHQHGKICFQTIQNAAKQSKVWTACEDFIDYFPSAHWYGKCISKCGDAFKNNFGNFAYNHRLHKGWGQIGDDWINQHEEDELNDYKSTPNGKEDLLIDLDEKFGKYVNENNGMSHRSPWREGIIRGELQDMSAEDVQSATEVKIFAWSATDLGPKSYPYCQLQMWYDWETCDTVPAADKEACGTACHEKHQEFRNKFDEFTKNSYSITQFRAAQENYEKVLHKLNRWEGDRTRLRKSIA
jgi:hypothetical protein